MSRADALNQSPSRADEHYEHEKLQATASKAFEAAVDRCVADKVKDKAVMDAHIGDGFDDKFFTLLLTGKEKFRKSEKPPKTQRGPVTVVVGKTFKKLVTNADRDVLLEFYAPWCGHCQALEPKYNELGKMMRDTPVRIAKIDAQANDFPSKFDVAGFPTIYFVPKGGEPVAYEGEREVKDFLKFIDEHRSDKSFEMPEWVEPPSHVLALDSESFADTSSGLWMVKFYAPWCGHCKALAPTWEELGAAYQDGPWKIAKVDCTAAGEAACSEQGVSGYPTLKAFVNGEAIDYDGERDLGAFKSWLKSKEPAEGHSEL